MFLLPGLLRHRCPNCCFALDTYFVPFVVSHKIWSFISELHNINVTLSIQLFCFPPYQYQYPYQLFQRGLINNQFLVNLSLLSISIFVSIQLKRPYQYWFNINYSMILLSMSISILLIYFIINALCISDSYWWCASNRDSLWIMWVPLYANCP